jgi:hypothetical protein
MERIRNTNAHSWWRRLHVRLRSMMGAAVKSHVVHITRIGGRRYKRVTFRYASEAARVESNLEQVASLSRFPRLVYRHEGSVWVEYLEGRTLDRGSPECREEVIALFADLYRHGSYSVQLAATSTHRRLLADLDFLREVGVLSAQLGASLADAAEELRPARAWMGFEYLDPLARNFIVVPTGMVAIDIEALHAGQLLGIGLAKARLRWLEVDRASLLASLAGLGAPDIGPQYDYAALSFLAGYAKQNVFRGRGRKVGARDFEALLREAGG